MPKFIDYRLLLKKAEPLYLKILEVLKSNTDSAELNSRFGGLGRLASESLESALDDARTVNKSTPLTIWKNKWLSKNANDQYVMEGKLTNLRMLSLANLIEAYDKELAKSGLYDFDDMILKSIKTISENDELRYTLQEQFQYILLDEFQDTNASQLKLVELLTNNPASIGRPNIMAVGDDNQAIYAFQGAQYSNLADFYNLYRGTEVIHLTTNYRSHKLVTGLGDGISEQIENSLTIDIAGLKRSIKPLADFTPSDAKVQRIEFKSSISENNFIAKKYII